MPTIKENLEVLRAAIVAYPEDKLNLKRYHTCGTIYCAVGLAATMPYFTNQMGVEPQGLANFGEFASDMSEMSEMWGPRSFTRLFATSYGGFYDRELFENFYETNGRYPNDKELILLRLDHALQHHV